jgi:hypothetical protein
VFETFSEKLPQPDSWGSVAAVELRWADLHHGRLSDRDIVQCWQQLNGEVVEIEVMGGVTEEAYEQEEDAISDGAGERQYEHSSRVLGFGHNEGRMMKLR